MSASPPEPFVDRFLKSAFSGIAPWILLSVLAGPGRFEIAVAAALGLTLLVLGVGHWRGIAVHSIEVVGAVYFAALAVVGAVANDTVTRWLEDWAGVLSSVVLTLLASLTLLLRRPFTLSYAKDTAPSDIWDSPVFLRANYVISAVWAGAFAVSAAAGIVGGTVLHDPDSMWTAWIVPLAATFFAVAFTEFYPERLRARNPATGQAAPPIAGIFEWLPSFVLVTGIVGWIADAFGEVVGITLIAVGIVGGAVMRRLAG